MLLGTGMRIFQCWQSRNYTGLSLDTFGSFVGNLTSDANLRIVKGARDRCELQSIVEPDIADETTVKWSAPIPSFNSGKIKVKSSDPVKMTSNMGNRS